MSVGCFPSNYFDFDSHRPPLQKNVRIVTPRYQQILGISFFDGDVGEAIEVMLERGGFLVAPSGTCFARLREDETYRQAMLSADLAIADSGLMVLMSRLLQRKKIRRISGLKYLQQLLAKLKGEGITEILWVLPSERARQKLLDWSRGDAFAVRIDNCYVAPQYGLKIEDRHLLALIELGFITGDQKPIPDWADRFFLGWLFRMISQPRIFIPRLMRGFELPWLIWKYGEKMPVARGQ